MPDLGLHAKTDGKTENMPAKMERRILNVKITDRMPNSELRERSRMKDIGNQEHELKRKWGGHVARLQQCGTSEIGIGGEAVLFADGPTTSRQQ